MLLAAPLAAQADAGEVDGQGADEQPMGGIGVSYSFATTHLPRPRGGPLLVLELFSDPESRVIGCSVIYPEVADENFYCRKPLGKRTSFPAIGPDGNAAFGSGRVHVNTRNAETDAVPPDIEVLVSDLPGELERYRLMIMAYIDESGMVRNCQRTSGDPTFSLVACNQARGHRFEVRYNGDEQAVPYVANLTVNFLVE